jgi:hypothetical protein
MRSTSQKTSKELIESYRDIVPIVGRLGGNATSMSELSAQSRISRQS